ncbi:hypothetical protein [Clostridium saccharobutylicum]|uniref:Uncharacterized protein n=1 Tax=Clostridium saccharobutylicum DSM 13864 TaxID=1345695 RepID=U5MVE3_CLOSA|nr:hypothetical protein [Clostridium saccharobutylicum]AGX44498.1 hypothetical protein CLSA_c35370 [Clostridium saccharobutylicum DSM 13864]AQR91792.1 hypothetical protein CLOSC_35200 [Clostridium saccharobutylicum]AQS01694.1 hypothetical protein CSACC_35250 [Clostridium saccharobutylicum]AQS11300.1 hypothetical protein CLOBY_34560 [Clostridium saccharobutylicum]AQS15677.1 hypothetical protein CLOSACC_35250 [Clostridium saccharobutylicum]
MAQIKSKFYYEISTGNILQITSELQDDILESTKEQDMKKYDSLKNKIPDDIDYVEVEFGTLFNILTTSKSYKVNIETKKLEIEYYTQEEIDERNTEYSQQVKNEQALNDSISNISKYLKQNSNNISEVENYILQKEQNKILGVM